MIIKINSIPYANIEANEVTVYSKFTIAFYEKFVEWIES